LVELLQISISYLKDFAMQIKQCSINKRGFTLIEVLVAMVIFVIALTAIYSVLASVRKSSTMNEVNARVMDNLRTSIGIMAHDIRMAGLDRFNIAGAGIQWQPELPTPIKLHFTADLDMDGIIAVADNSDGIQEADLERITYIYNPANKKLEQCLSDGATNCDVVAENVENFAFTYFDENEAVIIPVDEETTRRIRAVKVAMTISKPAGISGPITRSMEKQVLCRNLTM
jgi:prepilin-type N-terminal cleavage/methylation domain-containing protein